METETYYEKFKTTLPEKIKSLHEQVITKEKELSHAKLRLTEVEKKISDLQASIDKLKNESSAFTGSKQKFDNYIGRLRRDTVELELREDSKKNLQNEVIPKIEDEVSLCKTNLKILTDAYYVASLAAFNDELDNDAKAILTKSDIFVEDFKKIYNDIGLHLLINDEAKQPIRWWSADEQRAQQVRLGLSVSKEPSYEEVWRNYHNSTKDTEPVLDEPLTPAEPFSEPDSIITGDEQK